MIEQFRDIAKGKTLALVGSGDSALKYEGKEDISIVLNGGIMLPYEFDYFLGFDGRLPTRDYFYESRSAIRIIGASIAKQDKMLYPDREEIKVGNVPSAITYDEWLEANEPQEPHAWFYYEKSDRARLSENNILYHNGNVAHTGLGFAELLNPDHITIYGIDLNMRKYFYNDKRLGGTYGMPKAQWMNGMIMDMANVSIVGGDNCRLVGCRRI